MREKLLYYAIKYKGEFHRIKKAIQDEEAIGEIVYEGRYLTILDKEYPTCLRHLMFPPFVLFYEGDIMLLKQDMLAIVGSRMPSSYGEECLQFLLAHVNQSYGVVSGVAKGIDALAHQEALQQNRKTIGVIGCGLNVIYPKENEWLYEKIKKEGLLLSEYPLDTKPLAYHFPWRNRLIAALGETLVVVEGKMKSGTMITVNEALQLGKDIHCFAHDIFREQGEGCNALIEQGCHILYNIESIIEI